MVANTIESKKIINNNSLLPFRGRGLKNSPFRGLGGPA